MNQGRLKALRQEFGLEPKPKVKVEEVESGKRIVTEEPVRAWPYVSSAYFTTTVPWRVTVSPDEVTTDTVRTGTLQGLKFSYSFMGY